MTHSRRDWLKRGLACGASGAAFLAGARGAFAQHKPPEDQFPHSPMDAGRPPGQTLPPEATNGPWRSLRAVQQKKVFDFHFHTFETPSQGENYRDEGAQHATCTSGGGT